MDTVYRKDQVLVGWKDNKAVYVASNKFGNSTKDSTCRRYNRVEKKYMTLPFPRLFQSYNGGMGGVDVLDGMVGCYRVPYRKKKWWFPIYTWSLSVHAVNAWKLRMRTKGKKEPYLDFIRELVVEMFETHGSADKALKVPVAPRSESFRFDKYDHWPRSTEEDKKGKPSRRNCKFCTLQGKQDQKAVFQCSKCRVPLHIHCFMPYHN